MDTIVTVFFVSMMIIGSLLIGVYAKIVKKIKPECTSSMLRNSTTGLLCLGIICLVSAISFVACNYTCNCGVNTMNTTVAAAGYFMFGIVITILSSIIKTESKKTGCNTGGAETILLTLGIITCIICTVYFFMMFKGDKVRQGASTVLTAAGGKLSDVGNKTTQAGKNIGTRGQQTAYNRGQQTTYKRGQQTTVKKFGGFVNKPTIVKRSSSAFSRG